MHRNKKAAREGGRTLGQDVFLPSKHQSVFLVTRLRTADTESDRKQEREESLVLAWAETAVVLTRLETIDTIVTDTITKLILPEYSTVMNRSTFTKLIPTEFQPCNLQFCLSQVLARKR